MGAPPLLPFCFLIELNVTRFRKRERVYVEFTPDEEIASIYSKHYRSKVYCVMFTLHVKSVLYTL